MFCMQRYSIIIMCAIFEVVSVNTNFIREGGTGGGSGPG